MRSSSWSRAPPSGRGCSAATCGQPRGGCGCRRSPARPAGTSACAWAPGSRRWSRAWRCSPWETEQPAGLASADAARLARLDPALDAELLVAGRAAWQVLAGAAGEARLRGRLLWAAAPYDVTYLVAAWQAGREGGGLTCPGGRRSAP